jgi:hypothetical protein
VVRECALRASTINEEERSVEAVLATEERVANLDLSTRQVVDEILIMRGGELPEQAVLVDSHPEIERRVVSADIRGSVRGMRIDNDELVGRMYFARDPASDDLWGKYRDGHADSVSPGFLRLETHKLRPGQSRTIGGKTYTAGKRPLYITTRWTVAEVSAVPFGADRRAKVRQQSTPVKGEAMTPRLRKYLESIGLRSEATEEDAQNFSAMLSGTRAQIANILETETQSETAGFAARAALEKLGVDPDDPTKELVTRDPPADPPPGDPPADPPADPPVDADAIRTEERDRIAMIHRIGAGDLPEETVSQAIREGWDEARVSAAALNAVRAGRTGSVGAAPAGHSHSRDQDVTVRSLAAGMMIGQGLDPTEHSMFRQGLPSPGDRLTEQDAEHGHALRGMSLPDLFREALRIETGRHYRTLDEAFDAVRSAGTSGATLSYIFGTNVYASLIAGWDTVGDTTQGWCDEEDVPNFLTQEDITFEGSARLERLPRGDTAKHATASDTHETYKIARYAKQWVMDEQDVIDDRFGALMKMAAELGEAARRLRPDFVYSLMLENPSLVADSVAVFHTATHGNLGTGALSEANLKVAIQGMGTQRDSNNNVLNISPTHLIGPPDLQWTARELTKHQTLIKLFADSSDPMYSTVNQIAAMGLTPVSDARLDATGVTDPRTGNVRTGSATNWFLAKAGTRSIRVAYRRGTGRRPQMRRFTLDRGQWGVGFDINHDIGAAFMDYRGWYKSTGAG